MNNNRRLYLSIGVGIVILDQLTKLLVLNYMPHDEIIRLFNGDLIWLVFVQNPGIAFGIRIIPPIVLAVISFVAATALGIYIYRNPLLPYKYGLPFAFIMGGAIGNLIDRIIFGKVTDFISVDFPDFIMHRWPVFNVADSAVSIGAVCLVLATFFTRDQDREPDVSEQEVNLPQRHEDLKTKDQRLM